MTGHDIGLEVFEKQLSHALFIQQRLLSEVSISNRWKALEMVKQKLYQNKPHYLNYLALIRTW